MSDKSTEGERYLMTEQPTGPVEVGGYVSDIVSAYLANHAVEAAALPGIIQSVGDTLAQLNRSTLKSPLEEKLHPAVPIKKSVFPSYIVCLEDGKKMTMLKRHLKVSYDMEPAEYRAKWGLPPDYPMIAPDYAEQRSRLAKKNGLGGSVGRKLEITAAQEPAVQQIP